MAVRGLCLVMQLGAWRPLVTADARARPLRHGPIAAQEGFRSRPVADAIGAPVLRDQGSERPTGHGKADPYARIGPPPDQTCQPNSHGVPASSSARWPVSCV